LKAFSKRAHRISYQRRLREYFSQIEKVIKSNNQKKYIYAYWQEFDLLAHKYGINSQQALKHLGKISEKLGSFLESVRNTTVIITADHGLVDTPKFKRINLADHPELKQTLALPLCGDFRTIYCYVYPSKLKDFENYITKNFQHICDLYKSQELVKKNYFGLFEPNQKLLDRVGDYALIMKNNYIMRDFVEGEKEHFEIGNHSGLNKEELFVPLVIINR